MKPSGYAHIPVLFDEVMEGLNIHPDGVYVDGTIGGGGHALGIARRLSQNGRLIGIDRDSEAVSEAHRVLRDYAQLVTIVKGNYRDIPGILRGFGILSVDGILLDLGVSSHQFDDPKRGFSYRKDAPLDMRMDQQEGLSARDVVNEYSEAELYRIIRDYGEDPFAKNIAKHIASARKEKPIETTFELADIIKHAIPRKIREKKGHPAKRTFQAIRIEVNGELFILEDSLHRLVDVLKPGGRMVVISFHSLEDRLVKRFMKKVEDPLAGPGDFQISACEKKSLGRVLTKKPVKAGNEELEQNPRSHSARLRIFERGCE